MAACIKVYRYGLLKPTENNEEVRRQMLAAHRYRNTLVEIERARRAALRALMVSKGDVAALDAAARAADVEVVRLSTEAKMAKRDARAGVRAISEDTRAQLRMARSKKSEAVRRLREARNALRGDQEFDAARDLINERAAYLRRSARAHCGAFWGTYLTIEAADQASRNMPLFDGAEPNDPRFVRWTGDGSISVQLQKGLAADKVVDGTDTRLRVEPGTLPPKADPQSKRSARKLYKVLAMRVGSEGRDPIWARWPMRMHRPFPEGAVVKWARVHLRNRGPREEWSVTFTVELPEAKRAHRGTEAAVAVNFGWRSGTSDEGLRVATWLGTDGERGRLVLSEWDLARIEKANDLRSIRDKNFTAAHVALMSHLQTIMLLPTVPAWFRDAVKTLPHWRSPGRLASLAKRWRGQRFDGDSFAYDALEAWRYHDHHIWEWEASQRLKALRNRKEIYRVFAAKLASRYETLVIEDFDLREVAQLPAVDAPKDNATARTMRHAAAVSELRMALTLAFGGDVQKVDPENITKTCHACGSVEHWDQRADVMHKCGSCGLLWDQDDNAATNLLRRRSTDAAAPEAADPQESRWTRAKRMAAEKSARASAQAGGA